MKRIGLKKIIAISLAVVTTTSSFPIIGNSIDTHAEDSCIRVTENQLYYDYNSYLKNDDMNKKYNEVYDMIEDVAYSKSGFDIGLSAFKSGMLNGPVDCIKKIVVAVSGSDVDDKQTDKEIALKYLQDITSNQNVLGEFYTSLANETKEKYGWTKDIYSIIENGFKYKDDKEAFAQAFADKSGMWTKKDILEMINDYDDSDTFGQINKIFSDAGIAVNSASVIATVLESMMVSNDIIQKTMGLINENSPLYIGLNEIAKDQKQGLVLCSAKELIKNGVFGKISGLLEDQGISRLASLCIGEGGIKLGGAVSVASLLYKFVGYALFDVPKSEDIIDTFVGINNISTLDGAVATQRQKIKENYNNNGADNISELKADYKLLMNLDLIALKDTAEKAITIAGNSDKPVVQAVYDKHKNDLTYQAYIDSCINNASAAANSYTLSDKSVTLTRTTTKEISVQSSDIVVVNWASDDSKVASVEAKPGDKKTAVITGISSGSTKITCTVGGVELYCYVTVNDNTTKLNKNSIKLTKKGQTDLIKLENLISTDNISWSNSNNNAVLLNVADDKKSAMITAKSNGTTVITCTADGTALICNVTVKIANKQTKGYKALYKAYIKEEGKGTYPTRYKKGAFVYIDKDNTPELALITTSGYLDILTIYQGEVKDIGGAFSEYTSYYKSSFKKNGVDTNYDFKYMKKKNLYYIKAFDGENGEICCNTWNKIVKGDSQITTSGSIYWGSKKLDYYWQGSSKAVNYNGDDWWDKYRVTKKKYNALFKKKMSSKKWVRPCYKSLKQLGLK